MDHESKRLARIIRKIDKTTKTTYKTNNKIINIIKKENILTNTTEREFINLHAEATRNFT